MSIRTITTRFPAKCRVCGVTIEPGATVRYDGSAPRGQRNWHVACEQSAAAPVASAAPVAGAGDASDVPGYTLSTEPRHILQRFDSMEALRAVAMLPHEVNLPGEIGWIERGKREPAVNPTDYDHFKENWYGRGIVGASQAIAMLESGQWQQGQSEMLRLFDSIGDDVPAPRTMRRRRVWSDQGDSLDIHRVWSGSVDTAWQRMAQREATGPKRVTIAASIGLMSGEHADRVLWVGAAALKLADILTTAGYDVCIKGVRAAQGALKSGANLVQVWTAKPFTAPLDMAALCIGIASATTVRHSTFQAQCAIPERFANGLGQSCADPSEVCDVSDVVFEGGPGVIAMMKDISDADTARAWIVRMIGQIQDGETLKAAA